MDVSLLIKHRLTELGLEQKDLAAAVRVTESYISQLLARKKAPPAPGRTDIYEKIGAFLKLPGGELSKLADLQRREELKMRVAEPPRPLFEDFRRLILRKCDPAREAEVARIFKREAFGELERLVTQKLLQVAQGAAKQELRNEESCDNEESYNQDWVRRMAQQSGRSYEETRAAIMEFLDVDVFHAPVENWVSVLDPLVESWDIDLKTFAIEVVLNRSLAPGGLKRFEFVEQQRRRPTAVEPGLEQFLKDKSLSGDASEEEIEFLKTLTFKAKRPAALYYYRELQNLRDPIHFTG